MCIGKQMSCRVNRYWLMIFLIPVICFADRIPDGYRRIASYYKIPPEVLYAVALTESGKKIHNALYRPWPWTLNIAGTPKRFTSRNAACAELKQQLAGGIRSIDIGLMQINWRWHHKRLRHPCRALLPYLNLFHGADLLKSAYTVKHSWPAAVGYYHSPGRSQQQRVHAKRYIQRYLRHVSRLEAS